MQNRFPVLTDSTTFVSRWLPALSLASWLLAALILWPAPVASRETATVGSANVETLHTAFTGPTRAAVNTFIPDDTTADWSPPTVSDLFFPREVPGSSFASESQDRLRHDHADLLWETPGPTSQDWLETQGISREDFVFVSAEPTPRVLYVHFRQRIGELTLDGTRLTLQWDRQGHLLRARTQLFEDIPPSTRSSRPLIFLGREEARRIARAEFPTQMGIERWIDEELVARPRKESGELIPFWRIEFSSSQPAGWFEVWIDAENGELLRLENLLRHGTISGRSVGEIEPITAGDPPEERAFRKQEVLVEGNGFDSETETDLAGQFSFDIADGVTYDLIHTLSGAVRIENVTTGRTPSDTTEVQSGSNRTHLWTNDNSRPADRDAFYHGTIAFHAVRDLDSGATLDRLDEGIGCRVDDTSGVCNAFWNGTSMTFYAAGGGCVSAARIADIVYHEYGHAVAQQIYQPFRISRDMDEAWSDYFAATITDSPLIGRGFLGAPETFVRELETDRVWPVDRHIDPHIQGLILAGALWDLRERIGREAADPLFHFSRYGLAEHFDEYMLDILLYDDDDADLSNGSPHFNDIIGAFRPHGIGDYGITLSSNPIPDVEEIDDPISGEISVQALLGLNPDSLALFYRFAGDPEFDRVLLTPTSVRRQFRATIPPPPSGSTIEYYWSIRDTSGNRASLPAGAPNQWRSFVAGPDETPPSLTHVVDHVLTEDQTERSLTATVDDNSGRVQAVWVEFALGGSPVVRRDLIRETAEGVRPMRYTTTLDLGSPVAGQILRYRLTASDDSRANNVVILPAQDWFEVAVVPGRTLEFELDPGGLAALGDWEWGQSSAIPPPPRGEGVWATVLEGAYEDDLISQLDWGPLDIHSYESARLEIEQYYDFVSGSDGARVLVSDDGETWSQILPGDGYPFDEVSVFGTPAFSGRSEGWESTVFSLDDHLGDQIWVRFETATDASASDLGWYLNRIRLANAQALIPPFRLQATSGESERVTLSWRAPRGVDLFSGRFLGYQIFRAEGEGPFDTTPIHAEALVGTQFVDRNVQNDQSYRYRVEALYTEGSSPPVHVTALPAAPQFVLDATEVRYTMEGISESDTTLLVRNFGRGTLEFDVFLGESDWSLDDARIEIEMETITEDLKVVANDTDDAFGNPDIRTISMRRHEDKQFGPMIEFTIEGHSDWGDSRSDFGGVLFLDTDRNLSTRPDDQSFGWNEQLNIGWESIVLFGALTRDLGSTASALFFDACCLDDAIALERTDFPEAGSRIRFSVPIAQLGNSEYLQVSLILASADGTTPYDRVPENPDLPWLIRKPRHGRAEGGKTEFLSFQFDAGDRGNGTYEARAFLRTNDPQNPSLDLPIVLIVDGVLPGSLSSLSLRSVDDGIDIVFAVPLGSDPQAAQIQRQGDDDRWTILGNELLTPDAENRFFFLDGTVDPGFTYNYRFRVVFSEGTTITYGPFETTFRRAVPAQLGLQMDGPNPFQNLTAVLLELPDGGRASIEVFSAGGRRMQKLLDDDLQAGVYKIEWDGRVENGESAPSGVYFIQAVTPSGRRSLRLLRIR